jgi:hypothetical protein
MVRFLIVPFTLSTIPFVLGEQGVLPMLFSMHYKSTLEGFVHLSPFLGTSSLLVNPSPLSVKTCVISTRI